MAFMIPIAEYFTAYHVETECGTEIVPCDVVYGELTKHTEGSRVESIERREGWYGRLSAPGYLDCTLWDGPHDTADAALAAVEQFDVDDNGDDDSCPHCGGEPHDPCSDCPGSMAR